MNELKVQPHRPMLEAMAGSVFCLVLPGNSQSSQRLTEAFLAGCIPVFVGPPWHTLPFAHEVGAPSVPSQHCISRHCIRRGPYMQSVSLPLQGPERLEEAR
jgi:hypothetical protein